MKRGAAIIKRAIFVMALALIGIQTLPTLAFDSWADMPLDEVIAQNPIIVIGKIIHIEVADIPEQVTP